VAHAASAAAALDAVAARGAAFDMVLGDIMMPGSLNGFVRATVLRERCPALPIVLMTGYAAEIHSAVASGVEVLPKPCVPEQPVGAIASTLAAWAPVAG
jgi:two-component system NtrC family sensor kinase